MFVRAGARLKPAEQARLRELNRQISTLTTRFKQNVLKATADGAVVVDDVHDLDGLSSGQIGAAAQAAAARGLSGKWLITLQNTTNQPPLAQLTNRALRERIYQASIGRALGGPTDNRPVIAQLVRLRAERAALLGYPSHAAYQLEDESAGTPQAVRDMISQVAPAALARARAEGADIQKLIDAEQAAAGKPSFQLQPWDWSFYAEQVRKQRYSFDQARVAPYFELDRVLQDGVFYAAHQLYGLTFKERKDLPVYQPDVRVFEVSDADGKPLALFLGDYFARDNKQGGAWMASYVSQSKLLNHKPVVANHLNIPKPQAGQPVLLTFDEVTGDVPRVRACPARHAVERALPAAVGHAGAARLRRVPLAVQRDVGARAVRGGALRAPLPDRRADAAGAARQGARGDRSSTRATPPPSTSRRRCSTRPGTRSASRRRRPPRACPASKRRRCAAAASTTRRCRRAITRPTSRTSSRAATRPATTPTCGARCWRATPGSGSTSTAG